ncbi:tripartite tricarboxylate transporter permease [Oceanobacillus damuensis]|uniref:tripartite tricarboxylate transporter permease n=1 Tax=Oceanobacillus damuensis TaxID=937928 RepID=UPI00082AC679|nr:tripartite tricarboxylate transporter permease [Oceanobacillus damuensis]
MELAFDFSSLFSIDVLIALLIGSFAGMIIGAIPGLGAVLAIVLMLPLTYTMEPLAAILMLLATYQCAEYGGSISAIVIGIPGHPASLVTAIDGNALAKNSSPGKALAYSLYASFIGGVVSALLLILLSVPLVNFALKISAPEYFMIGVLGLIGVSALSTKDINKSFISGILGLMAGTVGMDMFTGESRFTLGRIELMEGIGLIALLVGMFAFSEVFDIISKDLNKKYVTDKKGLKVKLTTKEFKKVIEPIGIGSIVGSIVGMFPGMGAGPSSWFAYSIAKSRTKNPKTFGKGNPDGIVAPESANNATVGGALIPLLSLGIPGSPATAIILGAFIIHGLQPGPKLFTSNPDIAYGIMYGFILTTIFMLVMGKFVTSWFSRLLTVSNPVLISMVLVFSLIGVYVERNAYFDLWLALIIGLITFILYKFNYSIASFILAFILSGIIEENLRRSLMLSGGSYDIFFTRTYSLILFIIIVLIILFSIWNIFKKKKEAGES